MQRPVSLHGVQTLRPTLLLSGFRHLVPWSGRGSSSMWLVGRRRLEHAYWRARKCICMTFFGPGNTSYFVIVRKQQKACKKLHEASSFIRIPTLWPQFHVWPRIAFSRRTKLSPSMLLGEKVHEDGGYASCVLLLCRPQPGIVVDVKLCGFGALPACSSIIHACTSNCSFFCNKLRKMRRHGYWGWCGTLP